MSSSLEVASAPQVHHENHETSRHLTRSPQPYHWCSDQNQRGYLPSPSPTPSPSDTEDDTAATRSESAIEVEDGGLHLVKTLPAPPIKPRKGLRQAKGLVGDDVPTPLHTPSQLHEEGRRLSKSYFSPEVSPVTERGEDTKKALERFRHRRRAELVRRVSELLSLCFVGYIVISGNAQSDLLSVLYWPAIITSSALVLYPFRLLLHPFLNNFDVTLGSLYIPATFDPAPLLYPLFLPILVAISLLPLNPGILIPNIVLGLSALPSELFSFQDLGGNYDLLHWTLASIPISSIKLSTSTLRTSAGLDAETLVLLFPLHQSLLRPLYYLTTTSLLSSELQLLSTSLINLLLLSSSSQSDILRDILWIGGLGLLFLCTQVLRWNVALERVPNWRFRRAGRVVTTAVTFWSSLRESINDAPVANGHTQGVNNDFSLDLRVSQSRAKTAKSKRGRSSSDAADFNTPLVKVTDEKRSSSSKASEPSSPIRHRRRLSLTAQGYLSMTPKQVLLRKWGYALYTYSVALALIMIPIRIIIGYRALNGHEPFGWAVGYLFGDLPGVGFVSRSTGLDAWIALPTTHTSERQIAPGWVEAWRTKMGIANSRLCLFAYWATVIFFGLVTVLYGLKASVEVDTRRKVFHGMMVLMLLPSAYIDPCFLALGLTLVLAVFLLLDLFRASQLKPLAKPLATFLTPYVDGRDLRGPVVVSHIFLLIGCAIPLWLSLAGIERVPDSSMNPWNGWELETRDISMVAGVVCVGMGDAAASLVGRRFGRHKWPWAGGKSLEGSAAFAVAVTIGLLASKAWLHAGGWRSDAGDAAWAIIAAKAGAAGCGASFTEAVLTGANDNVVVPVVLWLLVRGLGM